MAAALSARSATGTVVETLTFAHIDITGADDNELDGTEKRYYIFADAPTSANDMRSHVFNVSSDGKHTWDNVLFPVDGSWVIRLRNAVTDGDVATLSLSVVNRV